MKYGPDKLLTEYFIKLMVIMLMDKYRVAVQLL
jgi:hypothetical protein